MKKSTFIIQEIRELLDRRKVVVGSNTCICKKCNWQSDKIPGDTCREQDCYLCGAPME